MALLRSRGAAWSQLVSHLRIAGAGLDVFEHEPAVEPRLRELDNVETRTAMARLAADNVLAVLADREP